MANRHNRMGLMMGSPFPASARATPAGPTPSVSRNDADDKVFASMHRNKANFSVEKVGAVFAKLQRRKLG
jgi:hypothetical protein